MTRRRVSSRGAAWAAAVTVGAAVIITALGMWVRLRSGDVWPLVLTDWSLGSALLSVSAAAVGAVITSRLPRNPVGWLFLIMGVLTASVFGLRWYVTSAVSAGPPSQAAIFGAWAFAWVVPLNMTCLALLLLLFPHGRTPSHRWRPVAVLIIATGVVTALATALSPYVMDQTPFPTLRNPTAVLSKTAGRAFVDTASTVMVFVQALAVAGLVVRTRRSRGVERQQVKWFVFAALVFVLTFFPGFFFEPAFIVATLIALPAVPIAAGVGVLRYRLYDIDRVINRTVVYGAVTAVLAVAYLGTVSALRALTEPVAGDSALAVAASTLAVAALFQPVRRRVQRAVDRRFNRARYDATATVEALRTRLRDEVDLDSLKAELITVVCATMQPAGTTLWLREAER